MKKSAVVLSVVLTVLMLFSAGAGAYGGCTSFTFRYPKGYESAMRHYHAFSEASVPALSDVPVPGNVLSEAYSDETGISQTENMVAQGLWVTEEYILVTAYDSEKEYDSLLYVVSNAVPRELLAVIVLPDKSHSGGVASDGKNVYIARSDAGISYFSFVALEKAVDQSGVYLLGGYDGTVATERAASFITYYDNTIWLGEFNENSESYLCDYEITADGGLRRGERTLAMPEKLQGAAFFEKNGKTYLFASCSYGRTNTSDVYVFEVRENGNEMLYGYAFPPMTEEAAYYDGTVYLIFESAATHYSTESSRCPTPVDRIAALDADVLIDEKTENRVLDLFSRARDILLKIADFLASPFRKLRPAC